MTEEQIKKAVEFAEGFGVWSEYETYVEYKDESFPIKNIQEWKFYPLLLYRAVEGFNKSGAKILLNHISAWSVIGEYGSKNDKLYSDYQSAEYLTPKEQALEDVLKEVV